MEKLVSILGLLVALSLGAIAWIGMPATDVQAQTDRPTACVSHAAFDGYGISRQIDCTK
jgi:hypothetical protein